MYASPGISIYSDNNGLLFLKATICMKICLCVNTLLSFRPQRRFYIVGFKLVLMPQFFWRIENVPQLKFNIFPGPKQMKKDFKDFQGPKIQEFPRRARNLFILECKKCKSFIDDRANETTCADSHTVRLNGGNNCRILIQLCYVRKHLN